VNANVTHLFAVVVVNDSRTDWPADVIDAVAAAPSTVTGTAAPCWLSTMVSDPVLEYGLMVSW